MFFRLWSCLYALQGSHYRSAGCPDQSEGQGGVENLSGQDIGVKSHDQFGSVRGELGFYRKICCKGDDQCFLVCESFKNSVRIKTGTEFQKFECLARRSSDHNLCR